jgi:hypothetical protein
VHSNTIQYSAISTDVNARVTLSDYGQMNRDKASACYVHHVLSVWD